MYLCRLVTILQVTNYIWQWKMWLIFTTSWHKNDTSVMTHLLCRHKQKKQVQSCVHCKTIVKTASFHLDSNLCKYVAMCKSINIDMIMIKFKISTYILTLHTKIVLFDVCMNIWLALFTLHSCVNPDKIQITLLSLVCLHWSLLLLQSIFVCHANQGQCFFSPDGPEA